MGGVGSNGNSTVNSIANGHITVPAYTWKVVMVLPAGVVDPSQVTAATRTFAINMPNVQGIRNNDWNSYKTSVRNVEDLTGYNFFSNVPAAIQNSIENGIDGLNPPGTADQTIQATEDAPVQFTLNAVNPTNTALTTTVSQSPNGSVSCSGINCTYAPNLNFNGRDTFTFSVNNGSASSNASTLTINVTSVNDLPIVTNDQTPSYPQATYSDAISPISITASDVETPAGSLSPTSTYSRNGGAARPDCRPV